MRRCVTFRSALFESRTPGPHFINPDNFGEDLAAWLQVRLPARFAAADPIQEDYGCGVWTRVGEDAYWIALGKMDEEDEGAPADLPTWLVVAAYEPGFNLLRRLTHRPRREDLESLCAGIDDALRSDPGITDVQWWGEEPFHGSGSPHP